MRLSVLLPFLSAFALNRALVSCVYLIASHSRRGSCAPSDAKRDSELILLSPERLGNVGHGNSRPPCPPSYCTFKTSKLCWDGTNDIVSHSSCPRTSFILTRRSAPTTTLLVHALEKPSAYVAQAPDRCCCRSDSENFQYFLEIKNITAAPDGVPRPL